MNSDKEMTWKEKYFRGKKEPSAAVGIICIFFVITALIIWSILIFVEPSWCFPERFANLLENQKCSIDNKRLFGTSLFFAVIVTTIITAIWLVISRHYK